MLSFLHKAQRNIRRSPLGLSRDRRQRMEDWFLALFKDTLVYKHLATTPPFEARWDAHDYGACYDQLFQAHLNRVSALLRVCNNEGSQFVERETEALPDLTQQCLVNARKQLTHYLQSTVGEQMAELQKSLIAYDWIMQSYSTLQSRDHVPVYFFYYTTQVRALDTSGLMHDAGNLCLKAGRSLEGQLTRWNKVAFRNTLQNPSPEPLRALIPFYHLYSGTLEAAVANLDRLFLGTTILNDNETKVSLLLSCFPLKNLKELLQMSQTLLEHEQGAARLKLLYRAYAEYDEPLPNFLQEDVRARAVWQEVLREKTVSASSMNVYQSIF